MSLYDWSVTATNNGNADSNIDWTEGQAANSVNDSARAQMAAVAAFLQQINGAGASAGTTNAYNFTSASGNTLAAYAAGNIICFKANHSNTATPLATLNVDGRGPKPLKKFGSTDLVADDIVAGNLVLCIYDGTNFQILSPVAGVGINVAAFSALTGALDQLPYFTNASTMALATITQAGRDLLDDADVAAMLATLGTGTAAVVDTGTDPGDVPTTSQADGRYTKIGNNLSELTATASTARSNLEIANARNITFGTGAPGVLAVDDIYMKHAV